METEKAPADVFFKNSDLTLESATTLITQGLKGADFGEFYQEIGEIETISKTNDVYVNIALGSKTSGFGFRAGKGEGVGYSYSSRFNKASLVDAINTSRKVLDYYPGKIAIVPAHFGKVPFQLYPEINPFNSVTLEEKLAHIDAITEYARSKPNIQTVSVSYQSSVKMVHIITPDGKSLTDKRPIATLSIQLLMNCGKDKQSLGMDLIGGRVDVSEIFNTKAYKEAVDNSYAMAMELQRSEMAPGGKFDVVLAPGWPSVILHEAVGHGLEGDFNRKNTSVYSGKVGRKVASDVVTIIDQGNMPNTRGSLHFDDEGTPTQKTVLVENGVLKGYMQDRQNALLMRVDPTGNGRRQSYDKIPMPRMTNTYIENGNHDPEEIVKSVKDGIYVHTISNGQVDVVSGRFNMNADLCYRIRDGKIEEPLMGATIIGDGMDVIKNTTMVGNDMQINNARGMCGKSGQTVAVGNGQPTILVKGLTIGGQGK